MKKVLFVLVFICLVIGFQNSYGQWVQIKGLNSYYIYGLGISGTSVYAGTYEGGVYLSTDSGTSWGGLNDGLSDTTTAFSLTVDGSNVWAGTDIGAFLLINNGGSWEQMDNGLGLQSVNCITINETDVYSGTYGGIYLSTDYGDSWKVMDNGLEDSTVNTIAISGNDVFAGTYLRGVFLSTNSGVSWKGVNTGLADTTINCLAVSDGNIFAGTAGGVFLSTDNGGNWTILNNGLPDTLIVMSLAISGGNIFAGTYGEGVYLSTNNGASWNAVNAGLGDNYILSLAANGTDVYAGTFEGVWKRSMSNIMGVDELKSENGELRIYPNPVEDVLNVGFIMINKENVSIKIIDITGREVATVLDRVKEKGENIVSFNAGDLKSGVYFVKVECENGVGVFKLIKN